MDEVKNTTAEETAAVEEAPVSNPEIQNGKLVTLRRCLKAGCHYGHVTKRWNPKMAKFIYGQRHGIYLIDLNKTVEQLNIAYNALKAIVLNNGKVLFVGTRDNAKELVEAEANRTGSFYVSHRWLGGTLTNYPTIFSRIKYLRELNRQATEGAFDKLSKKELSKLTKKMDKLNKCLSGIAEMRKRPDALIVCDPTEDNIAVKEANKLNIPVFAICDTNSDPDFVRFPIPANDDANESVKLIINLLGDAIVEARTGTSKDSLVAYQPDAEPEATMKEAIQEADRIHNEKLQIIAAQRRERQAKYDKMQQERFLKNTNGGNKPVQKSSEAPVAAPAKEEVKEPSPKEEKAVEVKKEQPVEKKTVDEKPENKEPKAE